MIYLNLKHPEEEILTVSKTTERISQEHAEDLNNFGLSAEYLTGFKNKIIDTEALFDEQKERLDLKVLTEEKNKFLYDCYKWCRNVSLRIEASMGRDSIAYKTFPSKELLKARHSEMRMSPLMEIVHNIAEKYASELAGFGQSPEVLEEGIALLEQLREADSNQELQKVHKKEATQIRYKKFNELVSIVNTINKIGRTIYKEEPDKYIKFESQWKYYKSDDFDILKGDIDPQTVLMIKEDLDPDTELLLENTGTANLLFFAGENGSKSSGMTLAPEEDANVRLADLGEGFKLYVENLSSEHTGSFRMKI